MGATINNGDNILMKNKPDFGIWQRLVNLITTNNPFADKYIPSKNIGSKRKSFSESAERKILRKKKRKRKIAYQSKRINRLRRA